ncbi:(Fe-S)-binding protein [Cellulomonas wangsupingiae]|uniref:(Fe-S)-binding protein n=1 Tax=Cellulomonas wangsupingiae TaxID=2968085 RepID=UPI001D0EE186|nr:(Fe-S)-binding protein [Cellulomonas wangsupingiae]MCM0638733.1 (Fe-S)-binding protein [Cellulomonas wangsupingiae]
MSGAQVVAVVLAAVATVVGVVAFVRGVVVIVRTVRIGRPLPGRWAPVGPRLATLVREVLGHGRFQQRPVVRVAHWVVMVSFPVLVVTLLTGYGQLVDPRYGLPLLGHWPPMEWAVEAFAWLGLLGIGYLIVLRQRIRPRDGQPDAAQRRSRFFGSNQAWAYVVEATVLLVVLAVLALRGLEYALGVQDGETWATAVHFPLTAWFGASWVGVAPATLETAVLVVALVKILVSMAWFVVVGLLPTMGVAWHRFLAFPNVYAQRNADGTTALGPLTPLRDATGEPIDLTAVEDLPDDARLGVGAVEDLPWKGLLDVATCTECGRCQDQCPAWATGKPLSPKLLTLALRDQAAATAPYVRAARAAGASDEAVADPHLGVDLVASGVIDPDVLWACTTCGACVQQCPVDIEHVDTIVDIRRYQTLMESAFPAELGGTFTKMERRGNPWGLPARQRLDWAKGLEFDVPVVGVDVESAADVDWLFWVGCAGAFEDRARKTTRAVAELLHAAGVTFAVLGDGETCTGDPARRAGNELLYQTLAAQNVETLNEVGAQRIVVTCAHCFNTLSREYPAMGGRFDVVHHTQLLDRLVGEGRLRFAPGTGDDGTGTTVTYHDPCYLGRHNQVYEPPRELLAAAGVTLAEMPRNRETSFCCGAGGARMWMEETIGERIGTVRAAEAVATGAGAIATACPFCTVMLSDGVAAHARASGDTAGPADGTTPVDHGTRPAPGAAATGTQEPAGPRRPAAVPASAQVGVPEVADIAVLLRDRLADRT